MSTSVVKVPSTALAIYQANADTTIKFANEFALAAAAIMSCNVEQGKAIALSAFVEGLTLTQYKRRYHWIPGKGESMRASAMLSEFRMNHGGSYHVDVTTSQECTITFKDATGEAYTDTFRRKDMMLARWPWQKNPGWQKCTADVRTALASGRTEDEVWNAMLPKFKDNWGTELDWQNMLFARRVSTSLGYICPELTAGIYTPEELQDIDIIPGEIISSTTTKAAPKTASEMLAAKQAADAAAAVSTESIAEDGEIVDAEFTTDGSQDDGAPFDAVHHTPTLPEEVSPKAQRLIDSIVVAFNKAFPGEEADVQFAAALESRGVKSLTKLSEADLRAMDDKLKAYIQAHVKN